MATGLTVATGAVCLQGGGEFSAGCRPMDAEVLRGAGGPVVVTALAGAPGREYRTANDNGVRHYARVAADLGLDVEVVAAPDVREDPAAALRALERARLLVLPGGSPSRLLEALRTTPVGERVSGLLAEGGTVSGSSAGAMVLCAWTVLPERPGPAVVPGLGVVPGALVLPHWSGGRQDWLRAVRATVPPGTRLLGLPEESGVLLRDGRTTALGQRATELLGEGALVVGASVGGAA